MTSPRVAEPAKLIVRPDDGLLVGSTGRHEKRLHELAGLYRDTSAYAEALRSSDGAPVYWVQDCRIDGPGELVTGLSVLEPGRIGDEYYMTRGHLHAKADRAELYLAVAGRGVILLGHVNGESRAIEITAGEAVQVPGHWVHRTVNVGQERFVALFCHAADAGHDYNIVTAAGGMNDIVVADGTGWTTRPNPDHTRYRHR